MVSHQVVSCDIGAVSHQVVSREWFRQVVCHGLGAISPSGVLRRARGQIYVFNWRQRTTVRHVVALPPLFLFFLFFFHDSPTSLVERTVTFLLRKKEDWSFGGCESVSYPLSFPGVYL